MRQCPDLSGPCQLVSDAGKAYHNSFENHPNTANNSSGSARIKYKKVAVPVGHVGDGHGISTFLSALQTATAFVEKHSER